MTGTRFLPTRTRAAQGIGLILVLLVVAPVAGLGGSALWVNSSTGDLRYIDIEQVPPRDVAIVPGVGTGASRLPRILLERLTAALGLYRAGKVRAILVSGIGEPPGRDEVTTMVRWLRERNVPPEDILSDPAGFRTLDTMQRASRLLNVKSAVVCTQPVHIARTLFLARGAGMDAVGLETQTAFAASAATRRYEVAKSLLAVLDIYVTGRQPKYLDAHGARIGQNPVEPQPAAFNFLTSAISAGTAASHVATRP